MNYVNYYQRTEGGGHLALFIYIEIVNYFSGPPLPDSTVHTPDDDLTTQPQNRSVFMISNQGFIFCF